MRLNTFEEIGQALTEAIKWCKVYGLNWRRHVQPIFKNGQIAGYYVIDETFSTTIKKIEI